jgi:hypothetical protein
MMEAIVSAIRKSLYAWLDLAPSAPAGFPLEENVNEKESIERRPLTEDPRWSWEGLFNEGDRLRSRADVGEVSVPSTLRKSSEQCDRMCFSRRDNSIVVRQGRDSEGAELALASSGLGGVGMMTERIGSRSNTSKQERKSGPRCDPPPSDTEGLSISRCKVRQWKVSLSN